MTESKKTSAPPNDGFSVAELAMERVTSMSYTDFIRKRIAEPLGMANTWTPQSGFDRSRMAKTFIGEDVTPCDAEGVPERYLARAGGEPVRIRTRLGLRRRQRFQ
ncbi:MAG: beta-lactamase family protein [Firmicutes bacterium]|jgi:CubicO group peptidase (beta-lactamase class C family)|nr:beta-lactamase family protein [Bacillota bacterium]